MPRPDSQKRQSVKRLPQPQLLSRATLPRNNKIVLPHDGILALVDKSPSWTSFDVVAKLRSVFRTKRIGHAGTLDPMATGLLLICVGRATKCVEPLMAQTKEYTATVRLGATTESYDAETPYVEEKPVPELTRDDLQKATEPFTGVIEQIPPMYSARKVEGKRLYKLARKGITVEREPKQVEVIEFRVLSYDAPEFVARIVCSKGTYVRSLAHDMGQQIGCGAHLTQLRREGVGDYRAEDALTIDELTKIEVFHPQEIEEPRWD